MLSLSLRRQFYHARSTVSIFHDMIGQYKINTKSQNELIHCLTLSVLPLKKRCNSNINQSPNCTSMKAALQIHDSGSILYLPRIVIVRDEAISREASNDVHFSDCDTVTK